MNEEVLMSNTSEEVLKPRVPLLWKILVALLILILIIMTIALAVQGRRISNQNCENNTKKSKTSALRYEDDLKLPEDASVFQDLSDKELQIVRDYMLNQKALKLTKFENAKLSDNFIVLIEHLMAPKAEVLNHLDKGGKKPVRKARVIVSEGQSNPPVIREYVVEGIPNPTKYEELKFDGVQSPISFERRIHTDLDTKMFYEPSNKAANEAYMVLKESFGYWTGNCTKYCLQTYYTGIPGSAELGKRSLWVSFFRRVPGVYLHPVPFFVRVDVTSTNASEWRVDQVAYNNQRFTNVSDLLAKYRAGAIEKIKIPVLTAEQEMRSSLKTRSPLPGKRLARGPMFNEPDGKRFVIKGRKAYYMDWTFHISVRSSGSLGLYDVRFRNERVAYEISVQEGASFYSGHGPQGSSGYFLDSAWGLGSYSYQQKPGVDCPATATFLDIYDYVGVGTPSKLKDAVCVFELNTGQASRRHMEVKMSKNGKSFEGMWFSGGLLDSAVVIRIVSTPFNYDYTFDYILHENGVIEVRTATSGYAIHTPYNKDEDPYGYKTMTDASTLVHDHFILHKVDLDIVDTENSFQTLDVKTKTKEYVWEPGTKRVFKIIERSIKDKEKDATVKYDFDKPKYYTVINEQKKNKFGIPRGYRIVPISMAKQIFPSDFFPVPAASWTKYQIAVTKRKDSEPFGSSMFNQFSMKDPIFDFDAMLNDDEKIRGQDLVAWVTSGCLHIPTTEDVPLTTTSGAVISFVLKPFGYFEEDPSMRSKDSYYHEYKRES